MKKKIGRMIPYPLIEAARKVIHMGPRQCPVCQHHVRFFADSGYGFEVLERLQVVGGLRRGGDACPVCHSTSRERLIWFWLQQKGRGFRFANDIAIAHFAPEKGLTKRLQSASPANYTPYDFAPARYRHLDNVQQADLGGLTIPEASVDLLMCNHVLEHVPDVPLAMSEIIRVLKPGGTAILQVPIALKLDATIELGLASTPEDRIRLLGQDDHLRLFTQDGYVSHLQQAGFAVELYEAFEDDGQAATDWRLDPFETLFICRKPG